MAASFLASFLIVLGLGALFIGMLYGLIQISKSWKIALIERVLTAVKRRRNTKDTFRKDYGYSWDFFMVFKVYDEDDEVNDFQRDQSMKFILNQLTKGGLEIRLFYSLARKEVFCKIRCPLSRLQRHADLVDFKMCLDHDALQELCSTGRPGFWDPLKIPLKSPLTDLDPFEYIYMKYEFDPETDCTKEDVFPIYKRWPRLSVEDLQGRILTVRTSIFGNFHDSSSINGDVTPTVNPMSKRDSAMKTIIAADTIESVSKKAAGLSDDADSSKIVPPNRLLEESTLFRGVDRMKLIHQIISYGGPGGCHLDPYQLIKDQCILAYGPLHDMVELKDLEAEWITFLDFPWNQPVDKVKNYFGEKVGLYFSWLGHYTSWNIAAAIVGFFIWINVAADENNPNAPAIPYFCGFMAMWSALFLESWKRKEKTLALQWGMIGYEAEEQPRPQFKGQNILSPITGKPALYFSRYERSIRGLFSQAVVVGMVLVVIATITAIFALRIAMAQAKLIVGSVDLAGIIASLLIALQIQFLNGYFGDVALRLNNQENHRTDTDYEDALISKTFVFQFVNSFASLFYIAFVKPYMQTVDPCINSCMMELQTTLGTIFLTRLAVGNATELGVPLMKSYFEEKKRKAAQLNQSSKSGSFTIVENSAGGVEMQSVSASRPSNNNNNNDTAVDINTSDGSNELSELEKTYVMEEYNVMLGTFDDYAELVIQFGYTTLFIAGFPLATVLSLINNYVEIRVDGYKLCHVCRRPEPRSCEDIGTWQPILEVVSIASIFVNSGIVAFTSAITQNYTWVSRVWIFILMASGLFAIRQIVCYLVPDEPEEVAIQQDRQEYIVGKVLYNIEDEDDSALGKNNFGVPNYQVLKTDDDPM